MLDMRIQRLQVILTLMPSASSIERERLAAYISIEGFNVWATFVRHYCLSVMMGARTVSGALAAPSAGSASSVDAALQILYGVLKPGKPVPTRLTHRDEPDWFDRQPLTVLSRTLNFSTHAGIARALGFPERDFTDFRTVRNFYAHKSESTADKVRTLARRHGFARITRPSEILLLAPTAGGQALSLRYLNSVQASAGAMVQ